MHAVCHCTALGHWISKSLLSNQNTNTLLFNTTAMEFLTDLRPPSILPFTRVHGAESIGPPSLTSRSWVSSFSIFLRWVSEWVLDFTWRLCTWNRERTLGSGEVCVCVCVCACVQRHDWHQASMKKVNIQHSPCNLWTWTRIWLHHTVHVMMNHHKLTLFYVVSWVVGLTHSLDQT